MRQWRKLYLESIDWPPGINYRNAPDARLDAGKPLHIEDVLVAKALGLLDRVMFGSDQMVWPHAIKDSIEQLESLEFLTEQERRNILYNNAARFLELTEEQIASHL